MNTAETGIFLNPVSTPGLLAPITRIGGGEVRSDRAAASSTAAWDDEADAGSLSFGFHTVSEPITLTKTVRVRNYHTDKAFPYDISHSFRYANDAASGAVTLSHPKKVTVPPLQERTFKVTLTIDPSKLPAWTLNGGVNGGEGHLLQSVEFDGYLNIAGRDDNVHLAWQVLPRRSADVSAAGDTVQVGSDITLQNASGVQDGVTEVFSLLGTSPQLPGPPPGPGSELAVIDLKEVGARMLDTNGGRQEARSCRSGSAPSAPGLTRTIRRASTPSSTRTGTTSATSGSSTRSPEPRSRRARTSRSSRSSPRRARRRLPRARSAGESASSSRTPTSTPGRSR